MLNQLKKLSSETLVFVPIMVALVAIWALTLLYTFSEREFTLEQTRTRLAGTVGTLADFNELAALATGEDLAASTEQRTAAIWRALLQYPSANIWVESGGEITAGQPPAASLQDSIMTEESRRDFTVYAALPMSEALAAWRRAAWQRAAVLVAATVAFLLLTQLLIRALRMRAAAEREAAAEKERVHQLDKYKAELESTVERRTTELKQANTQLEKELVDRRAAEAELAEHDALLNAVTKSAAELLESHNLEQAVASVLGLIGQTVGVGRVQISSIATGRDGHLRSTIRYEWCAPGLEPTIDEPALKNLDLTTNFPQATTPLLVEKQSSFFIDERTGKLKQLFERADMRSFLQIPLLVEETLWGSLNFIDSSTEKREWSWAESDTMQTLANLVGVAITRDRYVRELADANMIVQNSPTILYRLKGEPSFPLTYVSHNITKFGHETQALIEAPNWARLLMDREDEARVSEAMARTLDKDATGSSIEFRLRTGDGAYRWVENRYTPVRDKQGRLVEIEGMIIDITERKAAEEKIAQLARTDTLTGLSNRATFVERLRHAFSASRRGAAPFAVLYLDLDHFKLINDTLGHPVGDALLCEVAERLKSCTRDSDVVARLGGDEFAILQTEMTEPANAGALSEAILKRLTQPYGIEGNDLHVTVSVGICPYDTDSESADAMLSQADLALYRSKEEGRNRYRFHSDDLDHQVLERVSLTEDLRKAIERGELELHYQPQVQVATGRIVGMEALVRWHHPERGMLCAADFVPAAEKTGAIIALGRWVLNEACRRMRAWRDEGFDLPAITMNLSLAQLKSRRELIDDVVTALEKWSLVPQDLCFDVTEATLAQATLMKNDALSELRQLGVGISIDDFGSEYSSFDYLRTYRVSNLKMAQSFVDQALADPDRAATVRAILNLASELGISVITEGVETEEQLDVTNQMSVLAQGHYFSEALSAREADELVRRGHIGRPKLAEDRGDEEDAEHEQRRPEEKRA